MNLEDIKGKLVLDSQGWNAGIQQATSALTGFSSSSTGSFATVTGAANRMEAAVSGSFSRVSAAAAQSTGAIAGAASGAVNAFQGIASASTQMANTVAGNMARIGAGGGGGRPYAYQTGYTTNAPGGGGVGGGPPFGGGISGGWRGPPGNWTVPLPAPGGGGKGPGGFNVGGPGLNMLRDMRGWGNAFHNPLMNQQTVAPAQEPWRWNWGAAAGGGLFGRMFGGQTGGMLGAIGGGLGGPAGAVGGAAAGIGLHFIMQPVELAISAASMGLHAIAEAGQYLVTRITQLGTAFEKTQAVFGVIAGSPQAGNELMKKTRELALLSPYTSQQLYPQAQMLLGMGVSPTEVPSVLSRLGDIAGGDTERLGRLSLAYSQSKAAGRLVGYELRQFTEAGVGIEDFARAAGMSTREFRDKMQQGEIGPEVVARTINQITGPGGRFAGLSGRINQTVGGQYSALTEKLQMTGENIGVKAFGEVDVVGRMERIGEVFNRLAGQSDNIVTGFGKVIVMGDTLVETLERMADVGGWIPTWNEFLGGMDEFGSVYLPAIIVGLTETAKLAARIAQYTAGAGEIGFKIGTAPLNWAMRVNPVAQLMGNPIGAGLEAVGDLWSGAGGAAGDIARGINPETLEQRLFDSRQAALRSQALNRVRGNFRPQVTALAGIPFAQLGIAALNLAPRPGFQSPMMREGVAMDQFMGLTPADREYQEDFAKRRGGPLQQYAIDTARIGRLSRDVGPFSRLMGMEPAMGKGDAATLLKEAAEKLRDALNIPVPPLEKFGKRMAELDKAQVLKDIEAGANPLFFGRGRDRGVVNARFAEFQQMEEMVRARLAPPAQPTTRMAGSVESQDLLNQAANDTRAWQIDVKGVLDEMKKLQDENNKKADEFIKQFEKLNRDKIVVKAGEDK